VIFSYHHIYYADGFVDKRIITLIIHVYFIRKSTMILYPCLKEWYKILIFILTPILLIPIPLLFHSDVNLSLL
jgi:hypothetical protein